MTESKTLEPPIQSAPADQKVVLRPAVAILVPIFCGAAAAAIWGVQPIVSKFGYRALLSAWDITFLRFAVSGLVMLPLVLRRGILNACGLGWARAMVLVLLVGPLYSAALTGGLAWAPASHSTLIYPALTPILSVLFAKIVQRQPQKASYWGMGLLVAGVVAIGMENLIHPTANVSTEAWKGDLLFAAAASMFALYIGVMQRWETDPVVAVALVQVGGLLFLPVYFVWNDGALLRAPLSMILFQAGYHGILVSILSVGLFNYAIRELGAQAAAFTAITPLVGVILSVIALSEPASIWIVAGAVAIVAGLILSVRSRRGAR